MLQEAEMDLADLNAQELFGDAGDISSDEDDKAEKVVGEDGEEQVVRRQGVIDDEDEEPKEEEPPENRIEVEIPRIVTDLGHALHYVKLPNFLSVETRPYDADTYEDEVDEDEVLDEEGRARLKLRVENTIRWRKKLDADGTEMLDDDGRPIRESNARVVKWSDGSMSLHLGDEIFDVSTMPLQGDFSHLFVRQGTGLQGQSVFKTKLGFRPHSTDSFTHRKMTMSLADRSTKTQKVKILPITGQDPEANRSEMIKREEEKLRASIRRESQQRRVREKAYSRGITSSYLEGRDDDEDEEDDSISINAIKNKYKPNKDGKRSNIYSSDESEDEREPQKKTKRVLSDESEEEEDLTSKKRKAKALHSDSENEGEKSKNSDGEEEAGDGDGGGGNESGGEGGSDSE